MTDVPADFTKHNHLTDPGKHASLLDDLPGDVAALQECIRGLLLHGDYLELYGMPATRWSRDTRPVEKRIDDILARSGFALTKSRPLYWRAIVTCRDFALMTCSFLRHREIPARIRCGFATYLAPGKYEDHWVCEYWHAGKDDWAIADTQLDNVQCRNLGIKFDTACLPEGAFVNAKQAWDMYRNQGIDPALFGHGKHCGEWFMMVNLARDCLALNGCATSSWDSWREIADRQTTLDKADRDQCGQIFSSIKISEKAPFDSMHPMPDKPFWQR